MEQRHERHRYPRRVRREHRPAPVDELRGRGVEFTRYDAMEQDEHDIWLAPSGSRIAWFKDPDGNTLSFEQPPS